MAFEIPTIDFGPFLHGDEVARRNASQAIGEAAELYGFMKLTGHGIPKEVIAATIAEGAKFFALPEEQKALVQERRTNRGFQPSFDNVRPGEKPSSQEAFSMGHPVRPADPELLSLPFYAETPWPDQPGFREAVEACYHSLFGLGQSVLRAMAVHLGKPESFFDDVSKNTYSNMRVAHYPPQVRVKEVTEIGIRPHADQGLITLLIQDDVGGLEVNGPDGEWLPVVPDPEAIVINVAQLMTRWTNGRYKSALHRVVYVTADKDRFSIPLFVHPNFHQVIDPRDFAAPDEELQFEPIVAGERVYSNFSRQRKSWEETAPAT